MADKNVILHPQGDSSTNIYPKTKQANIIDLDLSEYATKDELEDKQDVISDLSTIRTGAGLGATSVQPSDLPTGEVDLTLTSTSISDGTTTLDISGKANEYTLVVTSSMIVDPTNMVIQLSNDQWDYVKNARILYIDASSIGFNVDEPLYLTTDRKDEDTDELTLVFGSTGRYDNYALVHAYYAYITEEDKQMTFDFSVPIVDAFEKVFNKNTSVDGYLSFWSGTQAEYDAITTKDASTLYIVKEN